MIQQDEGDRARARARAILGERSGMTISSGEHQVLADADDEGRISRGIQADIGSARG